MATFVLIPGAGSDSWYWHLVVPELRAAGHDVVAVDLPCDDDSAGLDAYTDAVVDAIGTRAMTDDLVVVAQSLGAFTAPLVCGRVPVRLMVLVAAMVPTPGETFGDWWTNTGQGEAMRTAASAGGYSVDDFDEAVIFLHDVPDDVIQESAAHMRDQSGTPLEKPWPLDRWPDVPTRFLLCRDDRLFPADFQRRVVRERLGIEPDEMPGGHLPALARPHDLAQQLLAYWEALGG
jgi:pimeloyl-ACP methyl ester carboxylesterase